MSLIEFIGFIIVMAAMIVLYAKRSWEERKRRMHPEQYADENEEQEQILRQFLLSLEGKEESVLKAEPPAPPPLPEPEHDEFEHQIKQEKLKMKGSQRKIFHAPGEKTAYQEKKKGTSRYELKGKLKEGIILKEILGKPKGL